MSCSFEEGLTPVRKIVKGTLSERLWAKVEKKGDDECWKWTGAKDKQGYGSIQAGFGRGTILAHRAVWEVVYGEIPKSPKLYHGTVVRHKCDNPSCCNPRHLELGTQAHNVSDMHKRGRNKCTYHYGRDHHFGSDLTDDQVREIRASTLSQRKLAAKFGVAQPAIGALKRRETYKYVRD